MTKAKAPKAGVLEKANKEALHQGASAAAPEPQPAPPAAAAEPADAPVEEKQEHVARPIEMTRVAEAEFKRTTWVMTAFEATDPKDLLKPEYWAHVSSKMRAWDRVEVRADDGTWYAEYLVLEAGRNWARMFLLEAYHLTTADVAQTQADAMSPYEVAHRGPHRMWSVIRKIDREVIHDGEQTMDGAVSWLRERLKADR